MVGTNPRFGPKPAVNARGTTFLLSSSLRCKLPADMRGRKIIVTWVATLLAAAAFAERINQEGRILGVLPIVTNSILFNTNTADAVLSAMQIFPVTNPWNEDISHHPLLANS